MSNLPLVLPDHERALTSIAPSYSERCHRQARGLDRLPLSPQGLSGICARLSPINLCDTPNLRGAP